MIGNLSPVRSDVVESAFRYVKIQGASTSTPTLIHGVGVTVARSGTGDLTFTFDETPGIWIGPPLHGFEDATMSGLAGFSVVWNTYVTSTFVAECTIYNASQAAADLTSAMFMSICFPFKTSNIG